MDTVQIYQDAASEWRWRRVADNGNIVADSGEGYVNRADCELQATRVNAEPYHIEVV